MKTGPSYKLSVGSAGEYEDLIAEIHFPGKAGLIISQEKETGELEVSVHSFRADSAGDFDYSRNVAEAKFPLADLKGAIEKAVSEMKRLRKAE